jgi:tetratricopeptide (TPR) repeat protein
VSSRLEQLQKFLQDEPDDVFTYYAIALEFKSMGRMHEAIEKFEEVIALDQNYVAAYHQLGILFSDMEEKERALEFLERGIIVAKRTGDLHAQQEMEEVRESLGT